MGQTDEGSPPASDSWKGGSRASDSPLRHVFLTSGIRGSVCHQAAPNGVGLNVRQNLKTAAAEDETNPIGSNPPEGWRRWESRWRARYEERGVNNDSSGNFPSPAEDKKLPLN